MLHVRRNRTENTGEFRLWEPSPHCVWVFDYFQDNLCMQNRFNIFVDDHSVPLDIFLHLPNYRTQDICKIIPTNLVLAASDLRPRTLFISVPECDIGHGESHLTSNHVTQFKHAFKIRLIYMAKWWLYFNLKERSYNNIWSIFINGNEFTEIVIWSCQQGITILFQRYIRYSILILK